MTPTQTEAHVESPTEIHARPGGILAWIQVGALLQFQSVETPKYYATAAVLPGYPAMVLVGERGDWGNPTFLVTMYAYDGQSHAKISLRSTVSPTGYWVAGKSITGFSNPISIAEKPGDFMLTDTGSGISIHNSFDPPAPYIRVIPPGVASYLSYGYPDPGGKSGLFNISIVG